MLGRLRALLARLTSGSTPDETAAVADDDPPDQSTPASAGLTAAVADRTGPLPPGPTTVASVVTINLAAELERVQTLVAADKLERAIAVLEGIMRHHPEPEVAATLDELRTIRRSNKRLRRQPHDPYAHFELGRALFAQERGEEALAHLEQACRLRPAWLEPHLLRAYELHWQGRWREAEAAYQAVLAIDPVHVVARRGLSAVRLGQPPDALMGAGERLAPLSPTISH